ncbi:uncharacterized protein LOC105687022 [Athalia rosae]|uniref:uncharacterized protein LOC105687022 n=1 Tax=Athalia rosae TaxID=37344 RepID=UPI0020341AD1|nr:uncharacterized protein LOC105687022 [Athalia rosae]
MSIFEIVLFAVICGYAVAQKSVIDIEKVEVSNNENPVFGEWSATLIDGNPHKLRFKFPIKDSVPDTMMMNIQLKMNGDEVASEEVTMCEAISDEMIAKGLLEKSDPRPGDCPIQKIGWEVKDYVPKVDNQLPDGKLDGKVMVYDSGNKDNPYITATFSGTIRNGL